MSTYTPEGKIGNPAMDLRDDPRLDRRLLPDLEAFSIDKTPAPIPLTRDSPWGQLTGFMKAFDDGNVKLYGAAPLDLPEDKDEPEVTEKVQTIKGVDGNDIKLYIYRKAGTEGQTLPAVVYSHGGGMVVNATYNRVHVRWMRSLAIAGCVCVMVDFRNAYTAEKHNPFPAGLNDCAAGVRWVTNHKAELGVSKVILHGESGGANLAIATALKAKKENWVKEIDGVFGLIPYISNAYGQPREELLKTLPSAVAHDGYFLPLHGMALMGHYYTPTEASAGDPLAWPLKATKEDLEGLPPHYIVVDELDPLRDEGMAFARNLTAAGVPVNAHMNLGTTHGAGLFFRSALPDYNRSLVDAVATFARRVQGSQSRL